MAETVRSRHSHVPLLRPPSFTNSGSFDSDYNEADFATANDFFPVRLPLETVKIGSWRYAAHELDDLELLYELESSDLLIR